MKIAIFSDNFYPELSGISDSVIALSKELAKRGHEIHFYVPKYSGKEYRKAGLAEKELELGPNIKFHRIPSLPIPSPTGQARLAIPLGFAIAGIKKIKPDIIHTQLFGGVGLEAVLAAKLNKIPLIGTNHTAITEFVRYFPIKGGWIKKMALKYAVWYYNRCDFVTAPSQSVFDEMAANGFKKPHQVLSNPIDIGTFNPKGEKSSLPENTVIYAGRLAEEKNIDVIIRAIALLKDRIPGINLAIAGHGAAEKSLKSLAEKLGAGEAVKFWGTVGKPALARLYRASKVFVITSTSETQSLTLMQALACGLPAVGARARALPEYINPRNGFLIKPGDYKDLADKILLLLRDGKLREKLSKGAWGFAQKFSSEYITDEWEKIYERFKKDE